MPADLASMDHSELLELMNELGEPKFRAKQVLEWLSRGVRPAGMKNIPLKLREKLAEIPYGGAEIIERRYSQKDETVKFLYELDDGNIVEGVLMSYSYGKTLCISSQVGCRMGCAFCASTLNGKVRDLTAGEMLSEVTAVERMIPPDDEKKRTVTNIVMMGSGEPLDNYDNTVRFLKRAAAEDGLGISPRNISVSTCGLVPRINDFIKDAPHVTLCISLHAHNDEMRRRTMPIANAYSLSELIPAAKRYADETGRRVIFEYALIEGENSSDEDARALAKLLRGINCHVNLIPLNSVKERHLSGVTRQRAAKFAELLQKLHISATVRRELGTDIDGACGQLRNKYIGSLKEEGK
ncbi:MAG: 23S rRNA (adenine(2503)-C(2))-methyltransferase RlmN [Clostridiales bacterium]|nr:23S rRNA (adenine(2503)-C(2))-methyltransferase RlmN [Clostridiales bacterium]